jgi:hypothetical protein
MLAGRNPRKIVTKGGQLRNEREKKKRVLPHLRIQASTNCPRRSRRSSPGKGVKVHPIRPKEGTIIVYLANLITAPEGDDKHIAETAAETDTCGEIEAHFL